MASVSSAADDKRERLVNVLYVWPSDWDVASLDPECLTAMVRRST